MPVRKLCTPPLPSFFSSLSLYFSSSLLFFSISLSLSLTLSLSLSLSLTLSLSLLLFFSSFLLYLSFFYSVKMSPCFRIWTDYNLLYVHDHDHAHMYILLRNLACIINSELYNLHIHDRAALSSQWLCLINMIYLDMFSGPCFSFFFQSLHQH